MAASLIRGIDSPGMRSAGRDLLSVALMDARNHTLHLATQLAGADQRGRQGSAIAVPAVQPLAWELGHIGWFQEWWIARNMQRARGRNCDPRATRLPSLEPSADRWWDDTRVTPSERPGLVLPDIETLKGYLLATLETTLELLESAEDTNEGLYFYRLALAHEDMHGEDLIVMAQATGVPLDIETPGPQPPRAPLLVPAGPWSMGSVDSGGFMFDNEGAQHTVAVPEFEIDAQVVNWSQYVEFVDDGGYDRAELWHPQGWQWLQAKTVAEGSDAGARAPLFVQQIGVASGAVMQNRFGTNRRMQGGQCVTHVSWWEADAWCRWAGRRLPAEVEWEMAAHALKRRGFRWGDVWEWTGSTARPYPGFVADPWREYSQSCFGTHKVLRGASFATRERMKNPRFRNFQLPQCDQLFCGFRSCAL
ncbi:MAG TPA: selenoneine synthase SenA [Burkholderiaceae bacterium]|nr:selenoneine synthase SenA [Burkholderiaceae bacterium]HRA64302.1 selenoneine synthase SenA [Burkholderiaceae bacterium]